MKLYLYHFTLKHDEGTICLSIIARSATSAARRILEIERAPFRSIQAIHKGAEIGTINVNTP